MGAHSVADSDLRSLARDDPRLSLAKTHLERALAAWG
jgi:hypothetical protein